MDNFDYIIAGGGAAGLSLAYQMSFTPLAEKKILIIDREKKVNNDHTWCYWANKPGVFDSIAYRNWENLYFSSASFHQRFSLGSYRYYMIRADEFYPFVYKRLSLFPNIQFFYSPIIKLWSDSRSGYVNTENASFSANWVLDGTFSPHDLIIDEHIY